MKEPTESTLVLGVADIAEFSKACRRKSNYVAQRQQGPVLRRKRPKSRFKQPMRFPGDDLLLGTFDPAVPF